MKPAIINSLLLLLIMALFTVSLLYMLDVYRSYLLQTSAFLLLNSDAKSRDAEILLNKAIILYPQDFQNHWLKAQITMNRGRLEQAEKQLLGLLATFDCYIIRDTLAQMYKNWKKDKHLQALLHMYRYYYLYGQNIEELRYLLEQHLIALITRGKKAAARQLLKEYAPLFQQDKRLRYLVGVLHALNEDCQEAQQRFHRFYLHFRNKRLRTCFVPCLLKQGENEWVKRVIRDAGLLHLNDPYSMHIRKIYEDME